MKTLNLNDKWDLHLDEKGDISIQSGAGSTALIIGNAVATHKGEHHADSSIGVDYSFDNGNQIAYLSFLINNQAKRTGAAKHVETVLYYKDNKKENRELDGVIAIIDNENNEVSLTL